MYVLLVALSPVTNIIQEKALETTLSVSWTAANGSLAGYTLVCEADGKQTKTNVTNDTTTAKCTNLIPGTAYQVTVVTFKPEWTNVDSSQETFKTGLFFTVLIQFYLLASPIFL